ncbi:MAG: carbohydrate kinase family protein [Patescibacteria group bacterium]|nr:carbohydrate kinase family protein [Patescibacteria group bacterium]
MVKKNKKYFDVISIGGASRDYTFYTDKGKIISTPQNLTSQKMLAFEYGGKIHSPEAYVNFGGGGANTAVSFAKLGLRTSTLLAVGDDDSGKAIIENLKKYKIDSWRVQIDKKRSTGFSFLICVDRKDHDHIAFVYSGASKGFLLNPKSTNDLSSRWIYIAPLSHENASKNLKIIFDSAKKNSMMVAWNPGTTQIQTGKRLIGPYLKYTDVLILNKDEAIELVLSGVRLGRKNPNHLNRPVYLLNILGEWGAKIVVITDGKKGSWAYDGKKIYHQKSVRSKAIDTTGAGDAFGSGFIAGLILKNGALQSALKLAAVNSASVVGEIGAQNGLLTINKINNKL